jgi:hypothetical protein
MDRRQSVLPFILLLFILLIWVRCLSLPCARVGIQVPAPLGIHEDLSIMIGALFGFGNVLVFDVKQNDRFAHVLPVSR